MNKDTIALFNAIQVEDKSRNTKPNTKLIIEGLKLGFVVHPSIKLDKETFDAISVVYGNDGGKFNQAFHKSWEKVRDASLEQLMFEQVLNYLSVYGLEAVGSFSNDTIFIPKEKLDIPELTNDLNLIFIKALEKGDVLNEIIKLSTLALKSDTIDKVMNIIVENDYNSSFIKQIKNRELIARLYDHYNIVPSEPLEFLRYLIYRVTGETLLIKNKYLFDKIVQSGDKKVLDELLKQAPNNLGEIFLRYKPIFLALKKISKNKTFFNRIRQNAKKEHKAIGEQYLKTVTKLLKQGQIDFDTLEKELRKATVFQKVKLVNCLLYRQKDVKSILYTIRNGKSWASDFSFSETELLEKTIDIVMKSIVNSMNLKVSGKSFYIPNGLNYAIPSSEKNYTGNIPSGSYIEIPDDLIVGIHWYDVDGERVDLDLSMINERGQKYGWNGSNRSIDGKILFSGDMTAAPLPNGASELFSIQDIDDNYLLQVNVFSGPDKIPAKIVVAKRTDGDFNKNYMIHPDNMIMTADIVLSDKETLLGLIQKGKVFFNQTSTSNKRVSGDSDNNRKVLEYLVNSISTNVSLNELIIHSGGIIVDEIGDDVIDLSPMNLTKNTLISLFI